MSRRIILLLFIGVVIITQIIISPIVYNKRMDEELKRLAANGQSWKVIRCDRKWESPVFMNIEEVYLLTSGSGNWRKGYDIVLFGYSIYSVNKERGSWM